MAPPKKWDGVWRLIIFDIPEKYRARRRDFQEKLKHMGCYQLQKSVWTHPFPCEKEIEMLKDFLHIKPYVDILIVSRMSSGKVLYHFRELLKSAI